MLADGDEAFRATLMVTPSPSPSWNADRDFLPRYFSITVVREESRRLPYRQARCVYSGRRGGYEYV